MNLRVLAISLAFTIALAAMIVALALTTSSADASMYASGTGGLVNWTAGGAWTCTAGLPGSPTCGTYPGSTTVDGDIANVTSANYTVNTSIPGAVTLNMTNGFGVNVDVASGGTLKLTGSSAVTGTSGLNSISISGGTLTNSGTMTVGGVGPGGRLDFNGGTLNGAGTTTVVTGGTVNLTGTQGPMTIDQQTVNNGATTNFTAGNTLTLSNGATFTNAGGGTFSANGGGSMATGAGTVLFSNAGSVNKGSGTPFTMGVPFTNTNTASLFATALTFNFTGGSGPSPHSNATWNLGLGGTMTFGGSHTFTNAQTFRGTGTINATGTFLVNTTPTTMTLPAGVSFNNTGTLDFASTTHTLAVGGNYTQSAPGIVRFKLGPTVGVSDAVNVTGTGTLGGTLIAAFAPPYSAATAADGDTFTVMTCAPCTGTFAYTPLAYANGFFKIVYNATSVQLVAMPEADISVTKSGPPSVVHTQNVTYLVTVTNNGPSAATSVNITDTFTNATYVSATPSAGTCIGTGPITCTIPALANGASETITVVLNANSLGTITNTATRTGSTPNDPTSPMGTGNDTATVATTVAPAADLSITKTDTPDPVNAGATLTYTLSVSNAGPDPSGTITVTDTLPAGVTFVSATGAGWTCSGTSTVTCSTSTPVAAASSAPPITIVVTAPSTGGSITNNASVSSTVADLNSANNSTSAATTVVAVADLSITKTLTSTLTAGSNATYSIVVTNNGPSSAVGVTVNDPTPPQTSFVSNTGACTSAFPCALGTLTAGATATITTTFAVASAATGTISNTATVSSSTSDPNLGNNSSTATGTIGTNSDVQITKGGPATANPGQNITFFISVLNNGPSSATGVTVQDPTPAGLTFVSNSGSCTTPFPCTIGGLGAGGSAGISSTYTVSPAATGMISNTATVTTTSTDPNAANNSSTATVVINAASDLAITKTGPAAATPGQTITYVVTVVNNGPSTSAAATVLDNTPAGLTFLSNSGACTTPYPCTIPALAPGGSATINSTFKVNAGASGSITNTATVSSSTFDPVGSNNSASTPTAITPTADLGIAKTGPGTLPSSGPINFTITVKNLGPTSAAGVIVNDTPSPGLVFVSNSGACSTPFPCSLGTLSPGSSVVITSTFNVVGSPNTVSNKADVSSSTVDPNTSNNSSTVTVSSGCPSGTPVQFTPFNGQTDVPVSGTMQWTSVGATSYQVYFGPAGSGCNTLVATVTGTSYNYSGLTPNTDYESRIVAIRSGCPALSSPCIRWKTGQGPCNVATPQLLAPQNGSVAGSPVTLRWTSSGAESYHVVVAVNGVTVVDLITTNNFADVTLPNGPATWTVTAISGNCTSGPATGAFNVCAPPPAPLAGVVGAPSSGRTYSVLVVDLSPNFVRYEFQEADNDSFNNAQTQTTTSPSVAYTHDAPRNALVFFYRVRGFTACTNTPGPYSRTVRVVILPNVVNLKNPSVNVPAGNRDLAVVQVFIPGETDRVAFNATSDRPWIVQIQPSSGILPPEGIFVNVTIDPAQLPNGTFTATVIVTTSPLTTNGRLITNGSTKSVPVTINLVTPVVPTNPNAPTSESLIIPAVGHLFGLNSQWRSDIRIYNASPQALKYMLNFTPQGSSEVKQTTIQTASGDTTALDDIIHNWYGVGEVGDSSTGVLEVRPMSTDGSTTPPRGGSFATVVSSRTFNARSEGTVGQFIPPVKFTNFVGNGSRLSMQQIAQSSSYRTNFGLVEASGSPVSLVLSMFNSAGTKLFDLPVNLAGGEQKLLNGLLAEKGVTVADGRMEVRVAGGDGKITAYASVIDNASLDPQLVPGATLGSTTSRLYVVPGVADLNNQNANWRTDLRVYNSGSAPQTANLVFYPEANSRAPLAATLTVNPNEVKVLDSVLQSLFAAQNVGGMVQITTATDSQLVVTGRTYNQTAAGTLGQFIRAATSSDGIGRGGRALNILQVEDSSRFRTNVGIAEMTGRPATVEISVILPDSKVTPSIQVPLAANEFRQFGVAQFGLGNIYNARVNVRVVDGDGAVTSYGSVIDQVTTDPTYVQAQQAQ